MQSETSRIEFLDFGRGLALIAMTVFHFAFDLELFGYQEKGFVAQPHWKYFARSIATSFLILTGFSLYLAHKNSIVWPKWKKRMLMISGAALIITIATIFATPEQFIFFGILHQIAFASAAGLLFLNLPWLLTFLLAIAVLLIGHYVHNPLFDPIWLMWTGLSESLRNSSDFVPVFPWFSAVLIGIGLAQFLNARGWMKFLARPQFDSRPGSLLKFLGRNSLVYYLAHQPVMIALILAFAFANGHIAFN